MATPTIAMIPSGYKSGKVYSVLPVDGTGDLTFTRASSATRVNESGLIETVATGVPRLDYTDGGCPSLLLEPQSTNLYLNSDTLVTQDVTTAASSYTVSFYGTGTITFSGTYAGSLVGTGVSDRVSLTFTATAGTLINTISGTVENGQCENLIYATSYIPTAGATATRISDAAYKTSISDLIGQTEGTIFLYTDIQKFNNNSFYIGISEGDSLSSAIYMWQPSSGILQIRNRDGVSATDLNISTGDWSVGFNKVAIVYTLTSLKVFINGANKGSISFSGLADFDKLTVGSRLDVTGTLVPPAGYKDVRVYNTALTDSELTTLTTI
jgi:hypothetical protein